MASLVATTCLVVSFGILVTAGLGHLRRPQELREAINSQNEVPTGLQSFVALALPAGEITLGFVGLAVTLGNSIQGTRIAAGIAAGLYLSFAGYSWKVLRKGTGAPCGCIGADVDIPISGVIPIRAGVLSIAALLGSLLAADVALPPIREASAAVILLASCTFIVLFLALPVALEDPGAIASSAPGPSDDRTFA